MDKITKFIECLLPVTACNLKCSYCYIIQEGRRKQETFKLSHSPEFIAKALSKKRLGGICYISICGAGETLIPEDSTKLIKAILEEGHYVNVTTNGTLEHRFDEIIKWPKEILQRLHFAFSFHYLELKRTKNVERFFKNIKKIKNAGCSFLVQINLCDDYIPYLDDIKKLCIENVGALPQVAATRDEEKEKIQIKTKYSDAEYYNIGKQFNSNLFDFTMKNFMVKRCEFCYAGKWAFALNLQTGELKQCYFQEVLQNIYEDINEPIKTKAVGKECNNAFCTNSSHYMSLGIIPSIKTPTYYELRNREGANWYNDKMASFLSSKLYDTNKKYSVFQEELLNIKYFIKSNLRKIKHKLID